MVTRVVCSKCEIARGLVDAAALAAQHDDARDQSAVLRGYYQSLLRRLAENTHAPCEVHRALSMPGEATTDLEHEVQRLRDELAAAHKTIRVMSRQHGQLHLRIAKLETELQRAKGELGVVPTTTEPTDADFARLRARRRRLGRAQQKRSP